MIGSVRRQTANEESSYGSRYCSLAHVYESRGCTGKGLHCEHSISPSGGISLIPPCLIVAPIPFSFSKEDYDIYKKMLNASTNIMKFENAEALAPKDNHDTEKALITESVKSFKDQRTLFCTHHPEMSVFNLSEIEGGPEATETSPEPCKK
jgi:hypothetical protein